MGIILNIRGTGGAGKTEFARRLMLAHAAVHGSDRELLWPDLPTQPIGYMLGQASAGKLVVLGHYERANGGCDTVSKVQGGLDEIFRLASKFAGEGLHVFCEGNRLSREYQRSAELALGHHVCILRLATPLEVCASRLIQRRKLPDHRFAQLLRQLEREAGEIDHACERLNKIACVEQVSFEEGLWRAHQILDLQPAKEQQIADHC